MEEDEEIFREMNEEDDFYMGDKDDDYNDGEYHEGEYRDSKNNCENFKNLKRNNGCVGIVLLILCIGIASLFI